MCWMGDKMCIRDSVKTLRFYVNENKTGGMLFFVTRTGLYTQDFKKNSGHCLFLGKFFKIQKFQNCSILKRCWNEKIFQFALDGF